MFSKETVKNFPNNSRFYILLTALACSLLAICLLRIHIATDQLLYIRMQQLFGFTSIALLYIALIISPLSKLFAGRPATKLWLFSRRAIGVSAFYFALLHGVIALFGQVGGLDGMSMLPERFQWAFLLGAGTLFVLFLMAITSFDVVVRRMTYRRWKWLHRAVYAASVLLLVHMWMIGTHMAYGWVQIALFVPICILLGLETWRIAHELAKKFPEFGGRDYVITVFLSLWSLTSLALFCLPVFVDNYHSTHREHSASEGAEHQRHDQ